jgi:hypothetical protein
MLAYMEHMAWQLLAAIGHGRPSLVVLAVAAICAVLVVTHGCPAVSASSHLHGLIGCPDNDPSLHNGQNGVHAVLLMRNGVLNWELVDNDSFEDEDAVQTLGNRP